MTQNGSPPEAVSSLRQKSVKSNSLSVNNHRVITRRMCLLEVFYVESVEESESENKNLRSRGIKISDECVYDHKMHSLKWWASNKSLLIIIETRK